MESVLFDGTEFRLYNRNYAVSELGITLKLRVMRVIEPRKRPDGYLEAGRHNLVHRMVATCWLANPGRCRHVHHQNRDKADNRVANLEWLSPLQHSHEHPGAGRFERSEETRQKLRDYRTGRTTDEATKQKQREAALRLGCTPPPRPLGYKCSEASKAKMCLNSPKNTRCEVSGVVYRSYAEAGRALGIKLHTLRKRCLSDSFGDYRKLD